ncbi:MAG: hypothetical protein J5592_09630 [Clostridia bacterium]|nr:hypothetical protein [Clostridia bacterium]
MSDASCGNPNMKCAQGVCVCGMPNTNSLGTFGNPAADPSWTLVDIAGGIVAGKVAVLAEGDAALRTDLRFLHKVPLFDREGRPKN